VYFFEFLPRFDLAPAIVRGEREVVVIKTLPLMANKKTARNRWLSANKYSFRKLHSLYSGWPALAHNDPAVVLHLPGGLDLWSITIENIIIL
jgi:hypothetical protein